LKKVYTEENSEAPISDTAEVQDFSGAFHVSIGWTLEQPTIELADAIKAIVDDKVFQNVKRICLKVEEIKVKVGNTVTSIFLPLKATESNGLFEY
jgi:U6 snRNA phosphodiesterase